jgi:hypothetical protein
LSSPAILADHAWNAVPRPAIKPEGTTRASIMDIDPLILSRAQFAFTIVFHIIFPSFTIGLSAYMAFLGALWLRTGEER